MTPRELIKKIIRECIIIGSGLLIGIIAAHFFPMEAITWIALTFLGLAAADWVYEKAMDIEDPTTTPQQDQTARTEADRYTELDLDTASIVNDTHRRDR